MAKLHIERVIALANAEPESRLPDVRDRHDNFAIGEIIRVESTAEARPLA
jgi:hypothetical protein